MSTRSKLRRRGHMFVYVIIILPAMFAIISLAVDLGRAQLVKSELQRACDATARGYLAIRLAYDDPTAQSYSSAIPGLNPVDGNSGVTPTTTITRGWWNTSTKQFVAGTGTPFAVQVVMSRKVANGKGVPMAWAGLIGKPYADVQATSVAALISSAQQTFNVSAQGDPWLAGMPSGSTASYDDVAGNAAGTTDTTRKQTPRELTIPVTPGAYITFSSISGQAAHGPTLGQYDPEGETNNIFSHGADSPGGPTPAAENGIGDVKMPIGAFMGVFLDNNAPSTTSAPSVIRDYTTQASRQQEYYNDILAKQPFYIGDGLTGAGSGTIQKFKVPDGVTRLFVGMMDGHEWSNNVGSFTVTSSVIETISLVQ